MARLIVLQYVRMLITACWARLLRLLSDADRSLGRLDGLASVLPNPDLFVAMHHQSGIDRAKRNMGKVTDELLTLIRKQV